jgi:hypothetical protein
VALSALGAVKLPFGLVITTSLTQLEAEVCARPSDGAPIAAMALPRKSAVFMVFKRPRRSF